MGDSAPVEDGSTGNRAGSLSMSDEELKAARGVDVARSASAFTVVREITDPKERPALDHFFRPTPEEITASGPRLVRALGRTGCILVPMHEDDKKSGLVHDTMDYLVTSGVNPGRVIVINDRSGERVVRTVGRFPGITLIDKEEMLDLIDWDKLLPVLGLTEPPGGGKGTTIAAGMLYAYLRYPKASAIVQHDADLEDPHTYDCLPALAYPLGRVNRNVRVLCSKIARPGRGNETTMTGRNALHDLATSPASWIPDAVRELAMEVYLATREHNWMLTGEFGLWRGIAYNRPFATGYLEETVITVFVEDCIRRYVNGHTDIVAQVVSHNSRMDSGNTDRKEFRMMDRIARFLLQYVRFGKPVSTWEIDDYREFNNHHMDSLGTVARIPSSCDDTSPADQSARSKWFGPVIVEELGVDRIIPGVKMLDEGGFLIPDKVLAFKARFPS